MNTTGRFTDKQQLTRKQEELITALLSLPTITAAALASGVAESTARRWWKLEHVQQAYKAAQKRLFDHALAGLLLKVDKAIETLDRNMDGEETPAATQVRAAQIVLEQALAVHKLSDLEKQIAELRAIMKERGLHEPFR